MRRLKNENVSPVEGILLHRSDYILAITLVGIISMCLQLQIKMWD